MANKIIDKNGKLFGKLSIIDLIAILLIVTAIVVVCIKFIGKNEKTAIDKISVEYTLSIEGIRDYSVDAINKANKVYSSPNDDEKVYVGEIISKEITPAKKLVQQSSGEYTYIDVPDKYDVVIKIKAEVTKDYYGYFFSDNLQLLSNSEFSIYNDYVKLTGKITNFEEK